jgi:hypothetical protein
MNHQDLRLYFLNSSAILLSLSQAETALRFTLLILSIIYTIWKLIDKKNGKKDD